MEKDTITAGLVSSDVVTENKAKFVKDLNMIFKANQDFQAEAFQFKGKTLKKVNMCLDIFS